MRVLETVSRPLVSSLLTKAGALQKTFTSDDFTNYHTITPVSEVFARC